MKFHVSKRQGRWLIISATILLAGAGVFYLIKNPPVQFYRIRMVEKVEKEEVPKEEIEELIINDFLLLHLGSTKVKTVNYKTLRRYADYYKVDTISLAVIVTLEKERLGRASGLIKKEDPYLRYLSLCLAYGTYRKDKYISEIVWGVYDKGWETRYIARRRMLEVRIGDGINSAYLQPSK